MIKFLAFPFFVFSLFTILSMQTFGQPSAPPRPLGNPYAGISRGIGLFPIPFTLISYSGNFAPDETPATVESHRLNIAHPIFKSETSSVALGLGVGTLHFNQAPVIEKTQIQVPNSFHRFDLSLHYNRNLSDAKFLGFRGSLGVASDKPFAEAEDTTFNFVGFYSFPGKEQSRWVMTVFISNNSSLINYFPIPGFIYLNKTENVTYIFGFPLASLVWTPSDVWQLTLGAFGPSLNFEAAYGVKDKNQYYVGYNWGQQSYMRSDREKRKDRLYFEEQKAFVGIKHPITRSINADLQMGHTFSRSIFESKRFSEKNNGTASLNDSSYAQWNLSFIF